jgi:hypothetical protein
MEARNYLLEMELGGFQSFENIAVFPLRFSGNGGPEYITLKEALERGVFVVTEVSAGGSVPELMVENKGEVAVLILDGEELAGAKQNRVLNTTILVGPKSAAKIPVTCTEQGRWSYVSNHFQESGHHMAASLRMLNIENVNLSLRSGRQFHGDQGAVWDGIDRMAQIADVHSGTGAMRDVFEAKWAVLEDYLKSFKLESGQKGAIVFIGGEVAGLDFVSREQAYGVLHAKLVKSYAMEAMLAGERAKAGERVGAAESGKQAEKAGKEAEKEESKQKGTKSSKKGRKEDRVGAGKPEEAKARDFLGNAAECSETRYQSVGLGSSLRYEGRDVIGSALAVDSRIVHMAFFRTSGGAGKQVDEMAAFNLRRRFRTQ